MTLDEFTTAWKLKYPQPDSLSGMQGNWNGSPFIHVKCPYCVTRFRDRTPDKGHHLHAHYAQEWFKCHRCGSRGKFDSLIGRRKNTGQHPDKWKSFTIDPSKKPLVARPPALDLTGSKRAPGTVLIPLAEAPRHHPAWEYLLNEGFSRQDLLRIAETHGVYVCLHGRQFTYDAENTTTGRLIFQIEEEKQILGWQARFLPKKWPPTEEDLALEKRVQKYLISPGLRKDFILYNWDQAQNWDMWVMVEGIKKVWKTGPFALCNFGIGGKPEPPEGLHRDAYKKFWSVRLAQANRPVVFLYDKGAENAAEAAVKWINDHGGEAMPAMLPEYGSDDLDEYHNLEIRNIIRTTAGRLPKPIRPQADP